MHELRDPVSQLSLNCKRSTAYPVPRHLMITKRKKTKTNKQTKVSLPAGPAASKTVYIKSTINFPTLPLKNSSSPFPVISYKPASFEAGIGSLLNFGQ